MSYHDSLPSYLDNYFCQVDRETDFLMHAHSMTDREGQGLISEEYNIEEELQLSRVLLMLAGDVHPSRAYKLGTHQHIALVAGGTYAAAGVLSRPFISGLVALLARYGELLL